MQAWKTGQSDQSDKFRITKSPYRDIIVIVCLESRVYRELPCKFNSYLAHLKWFTDYMTKIVVDTFPVYGLTD